MSLADKLREHISHLIFEDNVPPFFIIMTIKDRSIRCLSPLVSAFLHERHSTSEIFTYFFYLLSVFGVIYLIFDLKTHLEALILSNKDLNSQLEVLAFELADTRSQLDSQNIRLSEAFSEMEGLKGDNPNSPALKPAMDDDLKKLVIRNRESVSV
jgi:hypothetical protein